MADLEKVIRGWERCRKCNDVPMLFSESYRDCEYTRGMYCRQDILIEDTLALLKEQEEETQNLRRENHNILTQFHEWAKEQEAVEPTLIREGRNKHYNDYVCPRCDNEVVYEQNYCSECGVRFLWEGR